MKAGVLGASGYAGVELLRLCALHSELDVAVATAGGHVGRRVSDHTPSLASAYPDLAYSSIDPGMLDGLDLVFLALPHGQSQDIVPELVDHVGVVVDLAADFRLKDPDLYPVWYHEVHRAPQLLDRFVYGLPEHHRPEIAGARLIASPGCYPTAAILALAPFVDAGVVSVTRTGDVDDARAAGGSPAFIVDAASGVSGAGRAPKDDLHFGAVDEAFTAYGLLDHRHTSEMEQELASSVLFTPHLAPMVRGILATCYARPTRGSALTTAAAQAVLHDSYDAEPYLVVVDGPPSTKSTSGSNCVHVTARVDERTGWLLVLAALDNLVKGAAGQAIQAANLALGLDERTGLPMAGLYP